MPLPSGFEWIVILVIALLILGPGKLPDVGAALGKSIREFRKASSDVQDAVKVDTSPMAPASAPAAPAPAAQAAAVAAPAAAVEPVAAPAASTPAEPVAAASEPTPGPN
jgi:TatA/E family protein of Tat protein translocase